MIREPPAEPVTSSSSPVRRLSTMAGAIDDMGRFPLWM